MFSTRAQSKASKQSGHLFRQRPPTTHLNGSLSREARGIKNIYLMGLALDDRVKYSTLDARQLKFEDARVIVDGCRGIELVLATSIARSMR